MHKRKSDDTPLCSFPTLSFQIGNYVFSKNESLKIYYLSICLSIGIDLLTALKGSSLCGVWVSKTSLIKLCTQMIFLLQIIVAHSATSSFLIFSIPRLLVFISHK